MQAAKAKYEIEVDESFRIPSCKACDGLLKPDVVFFGGNLNPSVKERAHQAVLNTNGLLVIGSSLMVYSSFRLVKAAIAAEKLVAIVGRGATRADALAELIVSSDIAKIMSALIKRTLV